MIRPGAAVHVPAPGRTEERSVKKLEAIIRPSKLEAVKEALNASGAQGMTVSEIKGFGRQKGHKEVYRGAEYIVEFQPKLKIEVVVPDDKAEVAARAIVAAAATGGIGDGKVFIYPVEEALRIRTGETGDEAL